MKKFIDSCVASHPDLKEHCFITICDGYNGYDIAVYSAKNVIAGLYPTDTWDMKIILSLCDDITEEFKKRQIQVIEDRGEWNNLILNAK